MSDKLSRFINFETPGPVAAAFMRSPKPIKFIMGPFGSAKTTTCIATLLKNSMKVPRSPVDGVARAKSVVIRDTYPNLEANTLASFFQWMPKQGEMPGVTMRGGTGNTPGFYEIKTEILDKRKRERVPFVWSVEFRAIGDHNAKTFCDG